MISRRRNSANGHTKELGDFATVDRRLVFLSLFGIIIGIVAAFVAVILLSLIGFFTNFFYYGRVSFSFVSPAGNGLGLFAILVPVLGGLIVGLMARYGSERIRGHGIPEALEAIIINKSKIEPKVTLLKPLSTAISIGSGGPFGAEGPIIMTGGAFGSVLSQFLRLSSMERKTLLVAGAAAGMAATFNSPVSAILLSVELLLFEWKPRSLIPVGVASVTATLLRGLLINTKPLFLIPMTPLPNVGIVLSSVVVGLVAGVAATALTYAVYASEDAFRKLPIHWMWWPLIGGLVIGVGGVFAPRALGVGYDTIDSLLLGNLAVDVILVLVIVKAVIWSVSLGSGTSGGVLAPLLIIGGSLGALEGHLIPFGNVSLWALVSMGGIIGGTMRAPFTGVIFSLELTHDVNALLPLIAGALTAEAVTIFTMKRSILTEKVARRGVHVAREYAVDPLELIPVRSVMHKDSDAIQADAPVAEVVALYKSSDRYCFGYPVVDAVGALQGFLSNKQILPFLENGAAEGKLVRDILSSTYEVTYSDEPLRVAADRMAQKDLDCLPVVERSNIQQVVGLVSREDLFAARVLWFAEEQKREKMLFIPTFSVKRVIETGRERIRNRKKTSTQRQQP